VVIFIGGVYSVWGIGATVEYFKYLEAMRNDTWCRAAASLQGGQCFTPTIPILTLLFGSFTLAAGIAVMIFNKELLVLFTERTAETRS